MLLIDGHGLAFRGFYALPQDLAASDGTPTNAILGFVNMLMKALEEWPSDGVGIFFDPKGPTKRREEFEEYKSNRKPAPESFKTQLPIIMELCATMGLSVFTRSGVEADDCIVSTAAECARENCHVTILSADKDLFQVINNDIEVIRPSRGVTDFGIYDEESFREKYGFEPPLMADYLALVGDSADNIPGVPGIGDKTARDLVGKYGALESIYENIESVAKARRKKLEDNRDLAFRCRDLVVPQPTEPVSLSELEIKEPDSKKLFAMCERLGLKKLRARFADGADNSSEIATRETQINAQEATLDAILAEDELAIAPTSDNGEFVLASRKGTFSILDISAPENAEKFRIWAGKGTLFLYGCRELMTRYPNLPLTDYERIRDLEAANYLLHPDRCGKKGIERAIGMPLPEGKELSLSLFSLYDKFMPGLVSHGLDKIMNAIDLPLSGTLAKMSRTGIHVDAEMLTALEDELIAEIAAAEDEITVHAGERINLASPKQVSKLLFETLMLPPIKKNKSGFSTDASVLEELSKLPEPMCDVPKLILAYREKSKVQTGFVQPFLKLAHEGNGIIHSTFDHLATGTGRLASRDPNVQNMPVFGDLADRFRACFTPRKDGFTFVAADYSQIELRVLADITGEEKLITTFRDGGDIHAETASWVFCLPREDITPEQRRFAKVVNFGLIYGMSAFGLAQRLGVTRPTAARMVEKYFAALPKVHEYMEESAKNAKERGYTVSLFGRIRPLAEVSTIEGRGNNPLGRIAINTPLQSTAADIAKLALIRFDAELEKKFPRAMIVLQVHDSIVCECPCEEADAVENLLVSTMESVQILKVPLKAQPKRGTSLRDV